VTERNGWVTLEGSVGVEWQYQKILAEPALKKLRGVTGRAKVSKFENAWPLCVW